MDLTLFVQLLISGLLLGGVYALSSIGLTLIFGVMKIVNFAHGEFLMIAMYLSFWLFHLLHVDPYLSIAVVAPALFGLGLLTYRIAVRPTLGAPHLNQIFVMVGLSIVIENAVLLGWSADFRTVTLDYLRDQIVLGPYPGLGLEDVFINPGRLIAFFVGLAISVAFYFFLRLSYSGKIIRATSQDRSMALLMGIDIDRVYRLTFAVGLLLVGVAGALMIPMFTVHPFVGFEFVLVMFVVVVFGGMGSVMGAVLAGLFIGVVEVFSDFLIGPDSKQAVYFLLFIAVLVLKPSGLFGLKGEEEVERIEAIE
jgi:branched-chain amino acid transport system permease protein